MTDRTTMMTVTFAMPFRIDGCGQELPAGAYVVETDEELIPGLSFSAYRRVSTLLRVSRRPGVEELWPIAPEALDAALARDESASMTPA